MDTKSFFLIILLIVGCNTITQPTEQNCNCSLYIYSNLPTQNGVYQLTFNDSYVQTFTHLYVETECGLHTKVSWDTNYQYRINTDWVSLVNPSSMMDEDGNGTIVFGVWEEFIGDTISVYCGYTDDCGNHFVDSLLINIL